MTILGTIGDDVKLTSDGWVCSDKETEGELQQLFPLSNYGPQDGFFGYKALQDASSFLKKPFKFTGPKSDELPEPTPADQLRSILGRLADKFGGQEPEPGSAVPSEELQKVLNTDEGL